MWDVDKAIEAFPIRWPGPVSVGRQGDERSRLANVASSIREANRWVVHIQKRPFNPQTRFPASIVNQAHWGTFEQTLTALESGDFDGAGFVLGPDGSGSWWQGIDLDHVEANGLQSLASKLDGYVEYSPSGHGIHAIGYGAPFPPFKRGGIEAYSDKRFFTITGNVVRNSL